MKVKWYRPVIYYCACCLLFLLRHLPRKFFFTLSKVFAFCAFNFVKREREKAVNNLTFAFEGEKSLAECNSIAKQVFENMALTSFDFALFPTFTKDKIKKLVDVEGKERLDVLVEQGRGGIVLTAHLGNWELLGATLVSLGFNGSALVKRIYYDKYNDLIKGLRDSQGIKSYYTDKSPKLLLKHLKSGGLIGILPDQDISAIGGVFVDFFGKPAYTPTSPAKLALAANVPIVPAVMIRIGQRYKLVIDELIEPTIISKETKTQSVFRLTVLWSNVIERYIRKYPEQWGWVHNRWKTKQVS